MDNNDKLNASADQGSTDQQAPGSHDSLSTIAISATELIKMIESGQGSDVNELVNRMIQDRQAA